MSKIARLLLTISVYKSHFYLSYFTFLIIFFCYSFHTFIPLVSVWTIYAISYLFAFYFTPPPSLAALSDSSGSCKMKTTKLLHVTLPTLPFLFHWPQTPDFFEAKNRLLQTLTPPPRCPSPLSLFPSWSTGFYGEVSLRYAHCLLPWARQSPTSLFRMVFLCVRETSESFML